MRAWTGSIHKNNFNIITNLPLEYIICALKKGKSAMIIRFSSSLTLFSLAPHGADMIV